MPVKKRSFVYNESDSDDEFKDFPFLKMPRSSHENSMSLQFEIPASVQAVIDKIEESQSIRAKEDLISRLSGIMSNVQLIMTRYNIDSMSPGRRGSVSETQKKRRKAFIDKIAICSKNIDIRERTLTKLLSWLEEWNFVLSEVAAINMDEYHHWIAKMELMPEMLKGIKNNVDSMIQMTLFLIEEKKRQKKKILARGTLWKAWKDRAIKRPATAQALRPDQMICDQIGLNAKVSEIQNMLQELISTAMFSKLENSAIKYISSTLVNLSKALSTVNDELRLVSYRVAKSFVREDEMAEKEKDHSQQVIQELSEENEVLQQKLRESEEKCDQLIRIKNYLGRQIHPAASLRTVVRLPLQVPYFSTEARDTDSDEKVDSKKEAKSTAVTWDSPASELDLDVAKQQAEDKAEATQDQRKLKVLPLTTETLDTNLEMEEKKPSHLAFLKAPEKKKTGKQKGQEVKSAASSMWEQLRKGKSEQLFRSSPGSPESRESTLKLTDKEDESAPELQKPEMKWKKLIAAKTEVFGPARQSGKSQPKISKETSVTADETEQGNLESFQRAILAFLREKTNNVGKAFDPKSIRKEESSLGKAEVEKFNVIKAKMEEYFQKVAETVTKALRTYRDERKVQPKEKPKKQPKGALGMLRTLPKQGTVGPKSEVGRVLLSEITDPVIKKLVQMLLEEIDSDFKYRRTKELQQEEAEAQKGEPRPKPRDKTELLEAWKKAFKVPEDSQVQDLRDAEDADERPKWSESSHQDLWKVISQASISLAPKSAKTPKPQISQVQTLQTEPGVKGTMEEKQPKQFPSSSKTLLVTAKLTQMHFPEQAQMSPQPSVATLSPERTLSSPLTSEQALKTAFTAAGRELGLGTKLIVPRITELTRTPKASLTSEKPQAMQISQVTIEQISGVTDTQRKDLPFQQVQIKDIIRTSQKALEQETTPTPTPEQETTPTPEQDKKLRITLTPQQTQTLGITLTPEQTKTQRISLTHEQAQALGLTLTPEQYKEQRISLTPQQAQALGIILTPEQAKAQRVSLLPQQSPIGTTLTTQQAQAQRINLTPEQAEALGLSMTPQPAQLLGLTLTPQQAQVQKIYVTPQQAQALGITLSPEQAKTLKISLTPEQAHSLGIILTVEQARAQRISLTPQQAEGLGITLSPEQAQALGVSLTPKEQEISFSPRQAQFLGLTLTPEQTQVQKIYFTPQQAQALGVTLSPEQAKAMKISLTPEQAHSLGITLTVEQARAQKINLTPQQAQDLGITLSPEQAQALGVSLIPKEQEISFSPRQAQALGLTLTPEQAQVQKIYVTPQQAQALGVTLSPEQAKAMKVSLTPEQAHSLGITLTVEQARAQRINLTPQQAQDLGITLTPEQAQALGITLSPEQAKTLTISLTPEQAHSLGITLTVEQARAQRINLTPQQAQDLGITLTPEQAQDLGIAPTHKQAEALGIIPILRPEPDKERSLSLTPEQAQNLGISLTASQAKVMKISLTPEQAQALGITFTLKQAKARRASLTPKQAEALGITLTPEQAKAHRITLTLEQAQALGITLTPEQAQALGITLTPEEAHAQGILSPKKFQELDVPLTYKQAETLRSRLSMKQLEALTSQRLVSESIQMPKPAVASKQTQTIDIPLTTKLSQAFGVPLPKKQSSAEGISPLTSQQIQAFGVPLPKKQSSAEGISPLTPKQTQAFGVPLPKKQGSAEGISPLTPKQPQAFGVLLSKKQGSAEGISPLISQQIQAFGVPLSKRKKTELGTFPLTPKQTQAVRASLSKRKKTELGTFPLTPKQTQAVEPDKAMQPPLTPRQALPLQDQLAPELIQTLVFTITLKKAQNLGINFTYEQTRAAAVTLTSEQVAALEDALTEELAWRWELVTAEQLREAPDIAITKQRQALETAAQSAQALHIPFSLEKPATLVPSTDRLSQRLKDSYPASIPLQALRSSLTQAPFPPPTSLGMSILPDSEKPWMSPTYRQTLTDRGQGIPAQPVGPEIPSSLRQLLAPGAPPTPGPPLGPKHFFKPRDTWPLLISEPPFRPRTPPASRVLPTSGEVPRLVSGGSAAHKELLTSRTSPFQPPAVREQVPFSTLEWQGPSWTVPEQGLASTISPIPLHPSTAEALPPPGRPQRSSEAKPLKPKSARALGFEAVRAPFPIEKTQIPKISDTSEQTQVLQDSFGMQPCGIFQPYVTSSRIPRSQSPLIVEKALSREKPGLPLPALTTQLPQTPQISTSEKGEKPWLPPIDKPWTPTPVSVSREAKMLVPPFTDEHSEDRYVVDVEAQRRNLVTLNQAAQTSRLPAQYLTTAKNLIIELLHLDTVRLGYLSRKNQLSKRLKTIQNTGKGYESQSLYIMLDRIDQHQKKVMHGWTDKQKHLDQRRKQCLRSMTQLFSQSRLDSNSRQYFCLSFPSAGVSSRNLTAGFSLIVAGYSFLGTLRGQF
uniref:protein FAM186A n=1 Tax=Arvicanthis niloticus TaxID=61156 RepID=UPI0014867C2E|nr:protein FAM186A [Arvicanthis niloticus]